MKHLPRFLFAVGCTALLLVAEDFWVKKPFTEWSVKDAAKLLQNSPWSHEVAIGGGTPMEGGSSGGGRRGGGGANSNNDMGPGTMAGGAETVSGGARRGNGSGAGYPSDAAGGAGGVGSMIVRVRWQSAMPVRQAIVLTQLGREKADSDPAKKFLSQVANEYVVAVAGLPPLFDRLPDEQLNELAKGAALQRKDKDPIAAAAVQRIPGEKGSVAFFFPKTSAITLEDKEVEFVSKVVSIEVRRKFKLKDMVVGDKLEL
ncbi:MAG TPA: hypothetical protein VIX89_20630 [Bryobacteraceae bacterium]